MAKKKALSDMKLCIGCDVQKPYTEYWIAVRGKHERYHSRCKPCHVKQRAVTRPPKKIRGFLALPEDIQKDIVDMLNRKEKKKTIAKKHGLNYGTFFSWVSKGNIIFDKSHKDQISNGKCIKHVENI